MWERVKGYTHAGFYIGAGVIATALIFATVNFVREKVKG